MPNITQITAPRVPLIDERTNTVSREWYRFFLNLYTITGEGSGITAVINGGTGVGVVPTNGQLLIGNGLGYTLATLTPGLGISVTNGSGTITVANTGVTSVTGTAPVVSSGGSTPAISMPAASTSVNGYLTSTDWNTFNNKQAIAAPVTKTADFTVAATDLWLINNKAASTCTATLPSPSASAGRVLYFKNYQAFTLVSASSNVVPLIGGAASTAILADVAGDTATLVSDGTSWLTMQYTPNNVLLLE